MDICTDYIDSSSDTSDPYPDFSLRQEGEAVLPESLELKVRQRTSELQQANERLRESAERFRAIFEGAAIGIDIFDTCGNFIEINQKLCDILGYTWAELEGHSCLDFTHPDDIQITLDCFQAILTGEVSSYCFEKRFINKQGEIVWTNLTVSPLPNAAKKINHFIAVIEDITPRKQTEESLQTSERKLKAFLDNIPDIAWLKDKKQKYIAVNEAFATAFGIKPEDFVGKTDWEICPPYIAEKFWYDTLDVMVSGKRKSFETKLVDSDLNTMWFESIKNPIYDSQGELIGTAGIARNITERKRIEEELKRSQEQYKALFEILPIGVCVTDTQGNILEANLASKQILGLSKEDCSQWNHQARQLQLLDPKAKVMETSQFTCVRALTENKIIKDRETLIVQPHGKSTWVSISAAPIPLSDCGVVVTYVDITDRKKAEHIKDEFLAITSHELRTPL
ncbi:MAG TPA: hypothetical protein DD000_26310, partial [Cyanobacteria bacterium UBA11166]|nr:hypothetical protein [Cyanobacteria bacterium UBA11166]